jgi:PTH1 family peptidyl-tRNA hydrolase
MQVKLFVGLGNPGKQYEQARHNLGFMVLDEIASLNQAVFENYKDIADISFIRNSAEKICLMKPKTFMNLSGKAAVFFANYHKIAPEEILVFHDDFSLPIGEWRVRRKGSDGGHNGIKSIIECFGSQNFTRLKLGIGPLPKFFSAADFVLSKFSKDDEEHIETMKKAAVRFFSDTITFGLDIASSKAGR